jgi:hypothetical protein
MRHARRAIILGKGTTYKLTEDRIAALDAIGFKWGKSARPSSHDVNFLARVDELRAFKEKHGHLKVREVEDRSLYGFCSNMRRAWKGKGTHRLDNGRIAALDAIGFEWGKSISAGCELGRDDSRHYTQQQQQQQSASAKIHDTINLTTTKNASVTSVNAEVVVHGVIRINATGTAAFVSEVQQPPYISIVTDNTVSAQENSNIPSPSSSSSRGKVQHCSEDVNKKGVRPLPPPPLLQPPSHYCTQPPICCTQSLSYFPHPQYYGPPQHGQLSFQQNHPISQKMDEIKEDECCKPSKPKVDKSIGGYKDFFS